MSVLRHVRSILTLSVVAALLAACSASSATVPATPVGSTPTATLAPTTPAADRIVVVTTNSILADFVEEIADGRVELRTLVERGGDAHTFEPTPADSVALASAQVVIENGLEFEEWLDELYDASGSSAVRVAASDRITPLPAEEGEDHADEGAEHADEGEEGEEHGEYDPHIWHDVANAIVMVENIRDALINADVANAAVYEANANAYIAELQELDAFVLERVAELPEEQRKLVTSHDTFGYFAQRYGFTVVGTALGSSSTESADPAAAQIAELVNEIRAAGVPAIFAENVANQDLMDMIAREAGVTVAPSLYTDALGDLGSDGASYLSMMRYNVTTIVTALKG